MKISGAIFDMDGTLLDSMFIWDTIGADYLKSRGITPRENLNETFKNMSLYQAACYYRTEYGLTDSPEEIMRGVNKKIEHLYYEKVPAKEGVSAFLARLKQSGVKICAATATDRHLAESALKRTGLLLFFSEIFTCTSVGHGKDEPDIFLAAQQFLGTPKSETWVFEDALYAVRTAKTAGFPVVGVYDKHEKHTETVQTLSDKYIRSFLETENWAIN